MTTELLFLLIVPLIGAGVCAAWPKRSASVRLIALFFAGIELILGISLAISLKNGGWQELLWGGNDGAFYISDLKFGLKLGMDSISMWLMLLTVVLTPLAIAASFASIKDRQKEYYAWMLLLLAAMNGVFIARDLLLFYVFFELTLIPMFFIIGIWGGPERRYAAGKFFLFTFAGSVFTLAGIIYIGLSAQGSTGFDLNGAVTIVQQQFSSQERFWLLLAFLAGFAVKVPLFPVHTWLPLAHTEAPTAGSVILAGVLLKLGTYGLLKLAVPIGIAGMDLGATIYSGYLLPSLPFGHYTITMGGTVMVLGVLCVTGVIYGALVAWVQQDIKKLVAYSSVSHLGFCVLGLFALNTIGIEGSVLYMINHGISTGALFLCVGMIYDRYHTRDINKLSGLAKVMPKLAFFFILFTLSSIGLPGTNGFVSEFLTILGAFTSNSLGMVFGSFAALGIILGAVYMLHMAACVIWGPLKTPDGDDRGHDSHAGAERSGTPRSDAPDRLPTDIGGREIGILIPLALAVIILGVRPNIILQTIETPAMAVTQAASPMPIVQPRTVAQMRAKLPPMRTPPKTGIKQ